LFRGKIVILEGVGKESQGGREKLQDTVGKKERGPPNQVKWSRKVVSEEVRKQKRQRTEKAVILQLQ
jgi:hypothetical protein